MMTMPMHRIVGLGRSLVLVLLVTFAATACDRDPVTPPELDVDEYILVINSVEHTLGVYASDLEVLRTVDLEGSGSPTGVAARGRLAVVPLGTFPAVAIVDVESGEVRHVPLPDGSGATGVAFANDSIAVVGNPERNSVSPVNVLRATAGAEIEVDPYPGTIAAHGGRVYVMSAWLENWMPSRPGSVTVLDGADLSVLGSFDLSGENPDAAVFEGGFMYVVNAGSFGAANGSLSVVSQGAMAEQAHVEGFGDFPGSIAAAFDGLLYVAAYGTGLMVWDTVLSDFVQGPDAPLTPGESPPVSTVFTDGLGGLYLLAPGDCSDLGRVYRIDAAGTVLSEADTGLCPFGATTTLIQR